MYNVIFSILILPVFFSIYSGIFGKKLGFLYYIFCYVCFNTVIFILLILLFLNLNSFDFNYYLNVLSVLVYKDVVINFDIYFDFLNFNMLFIVFVISFFVNLFSIWYMWKDPNIFKFMVYLNFFSLFMYILVSTNNLIFTFVGWEGIGIFSYFLINFWHSRFNANRSALKAVFVNKIGDIFFYFFLFFYFFIFESFNILESKFLVSDYSNFFMLSLNKNYFLFLSFFLILACMAKSAQIFFHVWLPDAMEGPTPVSALLHAATMVTAGIFILIKFSWLIFLDIKLNVFLLFVGILTNFLASLTSIFQNDIKKIIAYSTSSQLGLIFIAFAIFREDLAFFHIFNHALFKALLFILSGVIIHAYNNKQDYRIIGNFVSNLYFIFIYVLVSSLTLIGIPYLSAFYSKEAIIQSSFINLYLNSFLSLFFLYLSIITTMLYTTKILKFLFYKFDSFGLDFLAYGNKNYFLNLILAFLSIATLFSGFMYKIVYSFSFIKIYSIIDPFLKLELEKYSLFYKLETTYILILCMLFFNLYFSVKKSYFINNFNFLFKKKMKTFVYVLSKKFLFDSLYFYFVNLYLTFNYMFIKSFDKFLVESNLRKFVLTYNLFTLNFLNYFFVKHINFLALLLLLLSINLILFKIFGCIFLFYFIVFSLIFVVNFII